MLTDDEREFLAQIAMGWFSMDAKGRIWRHARFNGPARTWINPKTRAERSRSGGPGKGYLRVMFKAQGVRRKVSAHRVSWILDNQRPIPTGLEINHKNGKKTDNRPENLEAVTRRTNVLHAIRTLGRKPKAQTGEENASAKVTEEDVVVIRQMAAARDLSQREIGEQFNLTQSAISAIVHRKSWPHIE